jgi:hypothetical protein
MADGMSSGSEDHASPQPPVLDLNEKGRPRNGEPQSMARRLFVQLLVFDGCRDSRPLIDLLGRRGTQGVHLRRESRLFPRGCPSVRRR